MRRSVHFFQSLEPLEFTLEGKFSALTRDRDPESKNVYSGVIRLAGHNNATIEVPVELSARGSLRRKSCEFIPLRVAFSKNEAKGTVFEMHGAALKLVTHCTNTSESDQFILREYLAYRIGNIVTPRSFRARLAHVTYVDSEKRKILTTRYAMFIEDDDDVARRLEGKIVDRELRFEQLHPVAVLQMTLFEFMIGNTDYSIFGRHNVRIVEHGSGLVYPIPYDFDVSVGPGKRSVCDTGSPPPHPVFNRTRLPRAVQDAAANGAFSQNLRGEEAGYCGRH